MLTIANMHHVFNEWMRRYAEKPAEFEAEFKTVARFLREACQDRTMPTYGQTSVEYMKHLAAEMGLK